MLNPIGSVGKAELDLLIISTVIMGAIVVPLIIATLYFAWRYRASNSAHYDPEFDDSAIIDRVTHFIPILTVAVIGALTWSYTHKLDPYAPVGDGQPYEIQAISLDYKWLFIYPEEGFATVNELVAPIGRPVTLRLTADPMMTSIFIPGLISQIYTMPGMETRSNFNVDTTAVRDGRNAMYSGPYFHFQHFKTRLVSPADFQTWISEFSTHKTLPEGGEIAHEQKLDMGRYRTLAERNDEYYPVTFFHEVEPNLFQSVVQQFMPAYQMTPLPTLVEYSGSPPEDHPEH
ncbi:MAG: COX aromatic rich motif-containing protein [Parvularculaceae bacterium]